ADEARVARAGGTPVSAAIRIAARLWDEELPEEVSPAKRAARPSFEDTVLALSGDGADPAAIAAGAALLPPELRDDLAPVLAALKTAIALRDAAIPAGADLDRWFRAPMGMW